MSTRRFILGAVVVGSLAFSLNAKSEFKDYATITGELKSQMKKEGAYASVEDVKKALEAKDWLVADVRVPEEWAGAHIKGSVRIGRQTPEIALENFAVDIDGNFVKDKVIVVCNSAARASIEAQAIKMMGFKEVKIFDIYSWIDGCNPVVTKYTVKSSKGGTGLKFGNFYAEHCIKTEK